VKINIHTDQFIQPANSRVTNFAKPLSPSDSALTNELSATSNGSSVSSSLKRIDQSRAARVAQLGALYSSGRYVANSTQIAQALVSGALSLAS
jgi:hypothetical protein